VPATPRELPGHAFSRKPAFPTEQLQQQKQNKARDTNVQAHLLQERTCHIQVSQVGVTVQAGGDGGGTHGAQTSTCTSGKTTPAQCVRGRAAIMLLTRTNVHQANTKGQVRFVTMRDKVVTRVGQVFQCRVSA
jgi:hypothetical protein